MKRVFVLIMTFTMLLLAGCSAVDAKLEQALLEKSGILEQEDYLQYQQYQEKGCLDEDGQYFDPDLDVITSNEQEKPSGKNSYNICRKSIYEYSVLCGFLYENTY